MVRSGYQEAGGSRVKIMTSKLAVPDSTVGGYPHNLPAFYHATRRHFAHGRGKQEAAVFPRNHSSLHWPNTNIETVGTPPLQNASDLLI